MPGITLDYGDDTPDPVTTTPGRYPNRWSSTVHVTLSFWWLKIR